MEISAALALTTLAKSRHKPVSSPTEWRVPRCSCVYLATRGSSTFCTALHRVIFYRAALRNTISGDTGWITIVLNLWEAIRSSDRSPRQNTICWPEKKPRKQKYLHTHDTVNRSFEHDEYQNLFNRIGRCLWFTRFLPCVFYLTVSLAQGMGWFNLTGFCLDSLVSLFLKHIPWQLLSPWQTKQPHFSFHRVNPMLIVDLRTVTTAFVLLLFTKYIYSQASARVSTVETFLQLCDDQASTVEIFL